MRRAVARADGSVLYNFAVAIDDLDAGVTHVVRGEDHLSNTPKQLLVLEALGASRQFLSMPWEGPGADGLTRRYFIWGATAAMLRNFYRFLSA